MSSNALNSFAVISFDLETVGNSVCERISERKAASRKKLSVKEYVKSIEESWWIVSGGGIISTPYLTDFQINEITAGPFQTEEDAIEFKKKYGDIFRTVNII